MADRTELTTVDRVREVGSYLFTATDSFDVATEVIVVPCEDGTTGGDPNAAATGDDATAAAGAAAGDSAGADGTPEASGGVAAWINRCTHEAQRFDTGRGVPMRDGEIVCPRHGSFFDACTGHCDNGEAAGTTLPAVDVAVEDGTVFLVDEDYAFAHEGGIGDGDGPSSTSHIGF